MKELTIEQKAKAYDEAVENMRKFRDALNNHEELDLWVLKKEIVKDIEYYFPELKENEDEKIRKEIISHLQYLAQYCIESMPNVDNWIAWLEKQVHINEEKVLIGARKDVALSIMNFLDRCTTGMCLSNMECADLESAVVDSDWSKVYDYMKKKLDKQGKQKSLDYENINIQQKDFTPKSAMEAAKEEKANNANKVEPKDYSSIDPHFFKTTDKVEPKFHEGEWVVYDGWTTRILKVTHDGYVNNKQGFIPKEREDCMRLWDITKDAKDGDVLACNNGWTCIFKTLVNDENFSSYCFMDNTKWFCETGSECHTLKEEFVKVYNGKLYPATKEQRDTFERAMADAGYAFDFERKELRKLSQSEVTKMSDQEEIAEIPLGAKDSELQEATYFIPKGFHAEIDDDKVVIKKDEKPTAWSEEDEQITLSIEQVMNCASLLNIVPEKTDKIRTWLKSLKQRIGG